MESIDSRIIRDTHNSMLRVCLLLVLSVSTSCGGGAGTGRRPHAEDTPGQLSIVMAPPSVALTEIDAMPALRSASVDDPTSTAPPVPVAVAAPELADDPGTGAIRLKLESLKPISALVKIRDADDKVVRQIHMEGQQGKDVFLDGGSYQMVLRVNIDGTVHYLKGAKFDLPQGQHGTVTLQFEVRTIGGGSTLQSISPEEFER